MSTSHTKTEPQTEASGSPSGGVSGQTTNKSVHLIRSDDDPKQFLIVTIHHSGTFEEVVSWFQQNHETLMSDLYIGPVGPVTLVQLAASLDLYKLRNNGIMSEGDLLRLYDECASIQGFDTDELFAQALRRVVEEHEQKS